MDLYVPNISYYAMKDVRSTRFRWMEIIYILKMMHNFWVFIKSWIDRRSILSAICWQEKPLPIFYEGFGAPKTVLHARINLLSWECLVEFSSHLFIQVHLLGYPERCISWNKQSCARNIVGLRLVLFHRIVPWVCKIYFCCIFMLILAAQRNKMIETPPIIITLNNNAILFAQLRIPFQAFDRSDGKLSR